jgi:hypothetical protein
MRVDETVAATIAGERLDRRGFLRSAGAAGVSLTALPAVLAACGDDDDDSGSSSGSGSARKQESRSR